jgi:hypothetical protein
MALERISEIVFDVSTEVERLCVPAIQYSALANVSILGITALTALKGAAISFLTDGRFTTLEAALLSSPYILPFVVGALGLSAIAVALFALTLFLAVICKCVSASLLGRQVTWENWKLLKSP